MSIDNILGLCAGLALFLYGMHMMSEGLELAAGNQMQKILEKLTSNSFVGVLVGASITAVIQSSSATTVMVVGFVNSGLMTLNQAVWIIMGANIGTTITGQLIALDVGQIAPLFALVGVVMATFLKNKKIQSWGQILAGLGILFIGMNTMSGAMVPLRSNETFINLMTNLNSPLIAIVVGAVFTAIIQSSSASVGILQTLAKNGLIGLNQSSFILFGQNIGTCITAFLASLGSNRNAKRTTIIHLMFNIIGTIIFVLLYTLLPVVSWIESISGSKAAEIANLHTLFNVGTTLLLFPVGKYLARLSEKILPITEDEKENVKTVVYLPENVTSPFMIIPNIRLESIRLCEMVGKNINRSLDLLNEYNEKLYKKIIDKEDYINYLSSEIINFIGKTSTETMQVQDSEVLHTIFNITAKLERIGNHAVNIARSSYELNDKKMAFVEEMNEIKELELLISESVRYIGEADLFKDKKAYNYIKDAENKLDDLTKIYRNNQMKRLQKKECTIEACVLYSRVLIDVERVSDYFAEIAKLCKEYQISFKNN